MIIRKFSYCLPTIALLLLSCCLPVAAQDAKEEAKQESSPLAGSWKWEREALSGDVRCELCLTEKDGKFKGTYSDAEDVEAKVGEVVVEDNEIKIALIFEDGGKVSKVLLQGKLDGDKIVGKMIDGSDEQDWKATRFVSLEEAAGHWRMEFTTPDGVTREPEFILKVEDGEPQVEFTTGEDEGEEDATDLEVTKVKFKDGLLLFDVKLVFEGADLALEYELEISGDELEGSMYFEFGEGGEQAGDVDVFGTRIK